MCGGRKRERGRDRRRRKEKEKGGGEERERGVKEGGTLEGEYEIMKKHARKE